MTEESEYIERTLIYLKRQYGKDELVASLLKQIKEKDIKIGELSSEVDYLTSELKLKEDQKEINRIAKIEARKDEVIKQRIEQWKSGKAKMKLQIKELIKLRDSLIAKLNKHENKNV